MTWYPNIDIIPPERTRGAAHAPLTRDAIVSNRARAVKIFGMLHQLHELFLPSLPLWNLIVRTVVVYGAVLMLLRLSGKRQVANLGTSELVALLLISNAVQNSMNGGDSSLTGGLVIAAVLMLMSFGFAALTYFSRDWEQFIQGRPTLLIHHGLLQQHNLRRELLSVR